MRQKEEVKNPDDTKIKEEGREVECGIGGTKSKGKKSLSLKLM